MTKKEISKIRNEFFRISHNIDILNDQFNKIADRRDAGKITAEKAEIRLADLDKKINQYEDQRQTTEHIAELLGISYYSLTHLS